MSPGYIKPFWINSSGGERHSLLMSSPVSVLSSGHLFSIPMLTWLLWTGGFFCLSLRRMLFLLGPDDFVKMMRLVWVYPQHNRLWGSQRTEVCPRRPREGPNEQVTAVSLSCHHSSSVSSLCLSSSPSLVKGVGTHSTMSSDGCSSFKVEHSQGVGEKTEFSLAWSFWVWWAISCKGKDNRKTFEWKM